MTMIMKLSKILPILPLLFLSGALEAAKPIQNLIDVSVPQNEDGSYPSLNEVRLAIIAGCNAKGWQPIQESKEMIRASIWVRNKHYAEVLIPFTEKKYSIIFETAKNLDYNERTQKIHRNYNKWVILLSKSIQNEYVFYPKK
jgi:hypothetical protein